MTPILVRGLSVAAMAVAAQLGLRMGTGQTQIDSSQTDWRAPAAAYLDERTQAWLDGPPAVGNRVECAMSCHTTHPYLFARPALGASEQRTTLRQRLEARVELDGAWADQTPFYGRDGSRTAKQALATEAVLNASALALEDHADGVPARATTLRAIERMWEVQRKDGGFDWLDFHKEPFEAGDEDWGAALGALAVAQAPAEVRDSDAAANLRAFLLARYAGKMSLHAKLTLAWASTELDGLLEATERSAVLDALTEKQLESGGWALEALLGRKGTRTDGYATALATFVLCRVDRSREAIAPALAWLESHQKKDGSWPSRSVNGDNPRAHLHMRDAATAYAVLALTSCAPEPSQ